MLPENPKSVRLQFVKRRIRASCLHHYPHSRSGSSVLEPRAPKPLLLQYIYYSACMYDGVETIITSAHVFRSRWLIAALCECYNSLIAQTPTRNDMMTRRGRKQKLTPHHQTYSITYKSQDPKDKQHIETRLKPTVQGIIIEIPTPAPTHPRTPKQTSCERGTLVK